MLSWAPFYISWIRTWNIYPIKKSYDNNISIQCSHLGFGNHNRCREQNLIKLIDHYIMLIDFTLVSRPLIPQPYRGHLTGMKYFSCFHYFRVPYLQAIHQSNNWIHNDILCHVNPNASHTNQYDQFILWKAVWKRSEISKYRMLLFTIHVFGFCFQITLTRICSKPQKIHWVNFKSLRSTELTYCY